MTSLPPSPSPSLSVASPPWQRALLAALAGMVALGWLGQALAGRGGEVFQIWLRGLALPLGGVGMAVLVIGRECGEGLAGRLELTMPRPACRRALLAGCGAGLGAFVLAVPLVWLSRLVLGRWLPARPPPALTDLLAAEAGREVWISVFLLVLVVAPLAEELLFRLVLVEAFRSQGMPHPAVPMAAAFALVHGRLDQMAGLCVLALWLYRLRRRHGSLVPAILAHAVFNALALAGAVWMLSGG